MTPKIILDTNILISALMKDNSIAAKVYYYSLEHAEFLISDQVELEYGRTLFKYKFRKYFSEEKAAQVLALISVVANKIKTRSKIIDCRDADDNKFLELAVDGKADYIISGDPDLLSINPFRKTKIITAKQFVEGYIK